MSETIETRDAILGAITALEGQWSPAWIDALRRATDTKEYRFVQDDNCHWYLIPANEIDNFHAWVQSNELDSETWFGDSFDSYRLNTHPSNYIVEKVKPDNGGYR